MSLTVLEIAALKPQAKTYRQSAGRSLYVVVQPTGSKSYEFRYKRHGKVRSIVIGRIDEIGLMEARKERDRLSRMLGDGLDPVAQRHIVVEEERARLQRAKEAAAARRAAATARREAAKREQLTLSRVADDWVTGMRRHWTPKHAEQIVQSLRDHVYGHLGERPIEALKSSEVLDVIDKLLANGNVETARRVRQRLDAIFEYAGMRHGVPTNPVASAKREITKRVKAASKLHPEKRFACVPIAEVPHLLRAMRAYVGTPVTRSLMWLVALTACRTGEARYATWDEFDFERAVWTIPAARMKARKEHRVPLSPPVIALLSNLREASGQHGFVIPPPASPRSTCVRKCHPLCLGCNQFQGTHVGPRVPAPV